MPEIGFNNQWIQICRLGDFVDASGKKVQIDDAFLNSALATFDAMHHEPPICIGHPATDAPAYGWTRELRRKGDFLEARFAQTNDEFEKMVERGEFKKRSAAFYTSPPILKHVGFLGAAPPAVKGLKNIQFNDSDGESVTVEFLLSEENYMGLEDKDVEKVTEGVVEKIKNFFKIPEANGGEGKQTVEFSEADLDKKIADAVKATEDKMTTQFNEKLEAKDVELKSLRDDVNKQSDSGRRSEFVSFVGNVKGNNHLLKNIGAVEFLEACDKADKAANAETVICFSEDKDGKREEHKFLLVDWAKQFFSGLPSVQFGEKFGNIEITDEVQETEMKRPAKVASMKAKMGIAADGGEK